MVTASVTTDAPAPGVEPTAVPEPARTGARPWWREPSSLAVLVTLLLWALPFTHATGGRDRFALTWSLLLLVPALAVVRPWRHLRGLDVVALAPAAGALVACFVAPTHLDGADELAAFVYAGSLYLLVRGYLAAGGRVVLVVTALLVAGVDQAVQGWWPWYGRQVSSSLMVGTFFWHNQFATFVAALALLGAAFVVRGSGWVRVLGGLVVVLSVPALAFAGSRATLALYVVLLVAVAAVSLRRPGRLAVLVVLPLVGLALAAALASPVLMSTSSSVASNVDQRQTLTGNGSARLAYDRVGAQLVEHHPWTGTGFDSFAGASGPLLPSRLQPTTLVHNGYLEAFVDGGVLLGLAVGAAALLPLLVGLRRLVRERLARRTDTVSAATLGSFAALGLLAAHSAVDFDWSYPSLLALYAVLAAVLVTGASVSGSADDTAARAVSGRRTAVLAVATAVALAVALPASAHASAVEAPGVTVPTWTRVATLGVAPDRVPARFEGAGACAARIRVHVGGADASAGELTRDLACTRDAGAESPALQMLRARALVRLGQVQQGEALGAAVAARYGTHIPQLLVERASLPAEAGEPAAARAALRAVLLDPRVSATPDAVAYAQTLLVDLTAVPAENVAR